MYKTGHFGLAALFVLPLSFLCVLTGNIPEGALAVILAVSLARIPDQVEWYFPLAHRGLSHIVPFGLVFSAAVATVGYIVTVGAQSAAYALFAGWNELVVFGFVFLTVFLSFLSHLVGDIISTKKTQYYSEPFHLHGAFDPEKTFELTPFWPLSREPYQLNYTAAGNPLWNFGLLLSGGGLQASTFLLLI